MKKRNLPLSAPSKVEGKSLSLIPLVEDENVGGLRCFICNKDAWGFQCAATLLEDGDSLCWDICADCVLAEPEERLRRAWATLEFLEHHAAELCRLLPRLAQMQAGKEWLSPEEFKRVATACETYHTLRDQQQRRMGYLVERKGEAR